MTLPYGLISVSNNTTGGSAGAQCPFLSHAPQISVYDGPAECRQSTKAALNNVGRHRKVAGFTEFSVSINKGEAANSELQCAGVGNPPSRPIPNFRRLRCCHLRQKISNKIDRFTCAKQIFGINT